MSCGRAALDACAGRGREARRPLAVLAMVIVCVSCKPQIKYETRHGWARATPDAFEAYMAALNHQSPRDWSPARQAQARYEALGELRYNGALGGPENSELREALDDDLIPACESWAALLGDEIRTTQNRLDREIRLREETAAESAEAHRRLAALQAELARATQTAEEEKRNLLLRLAAAEDALAELEADAARAIAGERVPGPLGLRPGTTAADVAAVCSDVVATETSPGLTRMFSVKCGTDQLRRDGAAKMETYFRVEGRRGLRGVITSGQFERRTDAVRAFRRLRTRLGLRFGRPKPRPCADCTVGDEVVALLDAEETGKHLLSHDFQSKRWKVGLVLNSVPWEKSAPHHVTLVYTPR